MSIPTTQPSVCLYFGCIQRPGHYVKAPGGVDVASDLKDWINHLDGLLHEDSTPRWYTHHFEAADGSHITIIAKRDRSIDSRPGSWSGFVMPDLHSLEEALRIAWEAWPGLKDRILEPNEA